MAIVHSYTSALNVIDFGGCSWQYQEGQSVTITSPVTISAVELYGALQNTSWHDEYGIVIYAGGASGSATGSPLTSSEPYVSSEIAGFSVTTADWCAFPLSTPLAMTTGQYFIGCCGISTPVGSQTFRWYDDGTGDSTGYTGGGRRVSSDYGATWSVIMPDDHQFRLLGADGISQYPVDQKYNQYLVAAANDGIYYGKSSTAMAALTAATGQISTANPLDMVNAFQKIYIANEDFMKVISFSDVRLCTAELGAGGVSVPTRGTELTGGTSGGKVVVDFVTESTGSAYIYGYQVNTVAIVSDDTFTDTGGTLSVSFAMVSAVNTGPHCYTWTPFANDTATYGTMPSKANLVTRYRGRLVLNCLSAPHSWHMSRVADPYDWLFTVNDPLSPINGHNGEAGEIADVPTAFIPQGDDYLIFGCVDSIQVLAGDPVLGGSIDELDDVTGIYGKDAWCKDEAGEIYFYGRTGLYKLPGGRGKPQEISNSKLPNLVTDLDASSSADRMVCTYDPVRHGVILSKTALTAGTNDNYFFDLRMDGIYPEDYPANCGIFCNQEFKGKTVLGAFDGYTRVFDDDAKSDDNGGSNSVITSYVGWVQVFNDTGDTDEGSRIDKMIIDTAGSITGTNFADTDNVNFSIYTHDTAEDCMEDIRSGGTAFLTVALISVGRQPMIRQAVRGTAIGFVFTNSTISETWAINKIMGTVMPIGDV